MGISLGPLPKHKYKTESTVFVPSKCEYCGSQNKNGKLKCDSCGANLPIYKSNNKGFPRIDEKDLNSLIK